MVRTWPGQTYEEWVEERRRDAALTAEEKSQEMNEYLKSVDKKCESYRSGEFEKRAPKESVEEQFQRYDHPNSLENSEATIIWIIVMAVGTIFKGNWIIWIVATIIWRRYITRHKIKK